MESPLRSAASRLVNPEQDTGTPRGKGRAVQPASLRRKPHADGFGVGRVMVQDTRSFDKGQTINARLSYALRAPSGRRLPIPAIDLHDWIEDAYLWGTNKSGKRALYSRDAQHRQMWHGTTIESVPLTAGSWTVLQSDEDHAVIPQMHTAPLALLTFELDERGTVRALYPQKKNTPTETATKQVSGEGQNN